MILNIYYSKTWKSIKFFSDSHKDMMPHYLKQSKIMKRCWFQSSQWVEKRAPILLPVINGNPIDTDVVYRKWNYAQFRKQLSSAVIIIPLFECTTLCNLVWKCSYNNQWAPLNFLPNCFSKRWEPWENTIYVNSKLK